MQFDFYCQLCMKRGCVHAGEPMSDKPTIDSVLADLETWISAEWEKQETARVLIDKAKGLISDEAARAGMKAELNFRWGRQCGLNDALRQIDKLRRTPATFNELRNPMPSSACGND